MLQTSNDKSFGLNDLKGQGIKLSTKAMEIFKEEAKDQNTSVQVKLFGDELFILKFNLEDIYNPDKAVTHIVGATVEALLNQISLIKTVQNKN
ncbi:hypothetical protein AY606_00785 [Acinetobacter sp. SFB]|uniref:hypothetical protein n=1 Tax=Acinetobacter sp. SFB TaxID=1805634 RepID=UPI0007D75ACD|nr:hypothetical protein [Acinetobacter sp. SFB]OAL81321.1 hypothetical protein AY606_00785 [Acinetobacter sp. SFB]